MRHELTIKTLSEIDSIAKEFLAAVGENRPIPDIRVSGVPIWRCCRSVFEKEQSNVTVLREDCAINDCLGFVCADI